MSHDFDDELERSTERRSRRNPRMRDTAAGVSSGQEGGYASERGALGEPPEKTPGGSRAGAGCDGRFPYPAIPKQPKQEEPGKHPAGARDRMCAAVQRGTAGSRAVREAAAGRTTGGNGRRSSRSDFGQSEAKKKRRRRIIAMIVAGVYRAGCYFQLCVHGPYDVTDPTLGGV